MVDILATAEFPDFKMRIATQPFVVNETTTNELREYAIGIGDVDWTSYNIFDDAKDHECIRRLAKQIHLNTGQFNENGWTKNNLWINGWVNVLYENESIAPHFHSAEKESYYSCNVSLDDYNSKTIFYPPWGDRNGHIISIDNTKGAGMLFPQWLWHEVPPITDSVRYTLGIDIHTDEMMMAADMAAPIRHSRKLHELYT